MDNSTGHNRMKLWVLNSTQDSMNEYISKTTAFLSHTELKTTKTKTKKTRLVSPSDSYT